MWSGRPSPRRRNDRQRNRQDHRQIRQDHAADFWNESTSWERKSHHVDPDAPTRPSGIERLAQTRPVEAARERWSLLNLDPFVSRILLIVVGFALVVPVAWTTRRTSDEVTKSPTLIEESALEEAGSRSLDSQPDEQVMATVTSQAQAESVVTAASTSTVDTSTPSTQIISDTTIATSSATAVTVLATREAVTTVATTVPVCGSTYVVRPGDSWTLIADRASIATSQLLATNGATARDMLYPDDELCLPPGARVVIPTTTVAARPATSAVPATTTTTEVIPPAPSSNVAEAIIRSVWPDDLEDRAVEIAIRESRLQSNAHNWCCVGLFQIHWGAHKSWLSSVGVTTKSQLYDAETNARAALALYQRAGGWGPWAL